MAISIAIDSDDKELDLIQFLLERGADTKLVVDHMMSSGRPITAIKSAQDHLACNYENASEILHLLQTVQKKIEIH